METFVLNKIKNIKIYTTNWCVYCVLAKRYFDEEGIAYGVAGHEAQQKIAKAEGHGKVACL